MASRIGLLLEKLGKDESVRVTGLSWKTLTRYAGGGDASAAAVDALALASGVPIAWVFRGEAVGQGPHLGGTEFALLPRYSVSASAGSGLQAIDEGEVERLAFRREWLLEMGLDPRQAGLVTAKGDSMAPTIPDGALMLLDQRNGEPLRSGYIYVVVLHGDVLVKRVMRNVDGTVDLISDNPVYPVQKINQVDLDGLHIAGRVFWIGRKL